MATYIASKIEKAADISLEEGQAKYRLYFVRPSAAKLYGRYQAEVDLILEADGYGNCIVAE